MELTDIYNSLTGNPKAYISCRIIGLNQEDALKAIKINKVSLARWRKGEDFLFLENNLERAKTEVKADVVGFYLDLLNMKSLFILNEIIDHYRRKGYGNLKQFQLSTLMKCIEMGSKVNPRTTDLPKGYEERIFAVRRPVDNLQLAEIEEVTDN